MMHLKEDSKVNSQIWMAISDWDLNEELEGDLADRIQAAFETSEQKSLIYQGSVPKYALTNLTRLVATHPQDLKCHVRRFYLAMIHGSKSKVLGALIYLMIMLRYKGNALSLRLIRQAEPLLGAELSDNLSEIIASKRINQIVNLDVRHSVLINGRSLPAAAVSSKKEGL